jgi:signal transduction histidine kinase
VRDAGPGIPEEQRARVFERFHREAPGTTPGSGLGLSIVSRVAELHGARVELLDATGGGLEVRVHFPPFQRSSR